MLCLDGYPSILLYNTYVRSLNNQPYKSFIIELLCSEIECSLSTGFCQRHVGGYSKSMLVPQNQMFAQVITQCVVSFFNMHSSTSIKPRIIGGDGSATLVDLIWFFYHINCESSVICYFIVHKLSRKDPALFCNCI